MTDQQFVNINRLYPNLLEHRHCLQTGFLHIFFVDKSISPRPLNVRHNNELDGFEISLYTDDGISINLDLVLQDGYIIIPEHHQMGIQTMGKLYENEVEICFINGRDVVKYYDRSVIMRMYTIDNIIN